MQLIFTPMGQPGRRFRVDPVSEAAVRLFDGGQHREGLDALDSAARLAGPTADHYYVKALMLAIQGQSFASPRESAELYRQANEQRHRAVALDGRFLLNFGSSVPAARWAIPGYADLVARDPAKFFPMLRAARACTFAPEAAIAALEDDRVRGVEAQRTHGLTHPREDAIARLRASAAGPAATAPGPDPWEVAEVAETVRRYEHATRPDEESCADGDWGGELALPAHELAHRLTAGALGERVRAACILGVRGERSAAAVAALRAAAGDRHLQVRAQALVARGRLAAPPGAGDDGLVGDLIRALRNDRSYVVREAAADALAALGARPEEVTPALAALLASDDRRLNRARPTFVRALARYGRVDGATAAAIQAFEPHEDDEGAFVAKAGALARLSPDPELVGRCVRFLKRVLREANWEHTRRDALAGLLDAPAAAGDAAALLVERLYLDPAADVRDYARRRLTRLDHELTVRLNAFADVS